MKYAYLALVSFVTVCMISPVRGQIIVADPAGEGVGFNASGSGLYTFDSGDYQARIGELFAPGGSALVLAFQLPTLAAGQVFTSSTLQTQLYGITTDGSLGNADLYGLGTLASPLVTTTPTITSSDYYQGSAIDTSATLIQSSFLTPTSTVRTDATTGPFTDTSALGSVALTAYLNAAYAGGANAGDYVYLRVSYDINQPTPNGNDAYQLLTGNAGGPQEKPQILFTSGTPSISDVPEPSSSLLVCAGLAGLAFMFHRRTRRSAS